MNCKNVNFVEGKIRQIKQEKNPAFWFARHGCALTGESQTRLGNEVLKDKGLTNL